MTITAEAVRRAADKLGSTPHKAQLRPGTGKLNVAAYLEPHNIAFTVKDHDDGKLFRLDQCIFDPSHAKGEASIIQGRDGVLRYQCFHESCKARTWKEARFKISGSSSMAPFTEGDTTDAGSRRFHFKSIDDLLASAKPIVWLIKGFLDAFSLAVLFGDPGSMKSFLAIGIGLCIAANQAWHGYQVRKTGTVFYIAGEGFAGLSRRIKAWAIWHRLSLENVPFFVSDRPAQFLDAERAAEVVAAVDALQEQHGPPVLIIIDTLNRNFGPGNESDTADMTKFIAAIDEHLRCRYQCAVLIVHHTGLTEKHRARGSIALNGALDWEYRLSQEAGGETDAYEHQGQGPRTTATDFFSAGDHHS